MAHVSVTRLRLRSNWYLPLFFWHSLRSQRQARGSDGCFDTGVRYHKRAFWTLTVWRDDAATRAFMLNGAHRAAMPKLKTWCDEASLVHWEQEGTTRPSWSDAEARLRNEGRTSPVRRPSPAHASGLVMGSHDSTQ